MVHTLHVSRLSEDDDVSTFFCTDDDLNDFIHCVALQDMQNGYSVTHLVTLQESIVGFFTLVTDSIQSERVGESEFPDYCYGKLPAMKIARLATHKAFERQGIGECMIHEAFRRAADLAYHVGCCVITVDAKVDAVGFYEKYSFCKTKSKTGADTVIMYMNLWQFIKNNLDDITPSNTRV